MEGSNLENVSFPSFGGSLLTVTVFFKPRFNITIVLNLRKMPRHIFFFSFLKAALHNIHNGMSVFYYYLLEILVYIMILQDLLRFQIKGSKAIVVV